MISLYTGAGGLDFGFEAAGFTTRVAVEMDGAACETLRANRRWPVIERSIYDVSSEALLQAARLEKGEADVVIGGPPCQPFSKAGYWVSGDAKRLDDPRASTLGAYLRIVEDALPKAFLLENVEGLAYQSKAEGLDFLLRGIEALNRRTGARYTPQFKVLKAIDFGVPQTRARFFMVAGREGQTFDFPEPTHGPDHADQYRTAWDAIGDIIPSDAEDLAIRGKWAALMPSIPEGRNYLFHTDRGEGEPLFGWRRRYWSFLLKLSKDLPSWTLQAQPGPAIGPFHWNNRRLSMRELCRLQTFPDDVMLVGSHSSIQRQAGNAVPSLLGEILGREIRTQLLGRRKTTSALRLLPPRRTPVPSPSWVAPVAPQFLALRGDHSPHPGTGKGHSAGRR